MRNKEVEKKSLHPRNKNIERYDLEVLKSCTPELAKYIHTSTFGKSTVDFSNPSAVKLLNKALLKHNYGISFWEFSNENLCPAIPGRADYIHYMADLLKQENYGKLPNNIRCFDIGLGASCIYPIIGVCEYDWNFIGSDIDPLSIATAEKIVSSNEMLMGKIECRLQSKPDAIFNGVLREHEKVDLCICNPPFHASKEEAEKASSRKNKNLDAKKSEEKVKNFSGNVSELVYKGGELAFIKRIVQESTSYSKRFYWFSSLVSKEENLAKIYQELENKKVNQIETIEMKTGNKKTRIVAWTFLSEIERREWREQKWS